MAHAQLADAHLSHQVGVVAVKDGTFDVYTNGELKSSPSRSTNGLYFKPTLLDPTLIG